MMGGLHLGLTPPSMPNVTLLVMSQSRSVVGLKLDELRLFKGSSSRLLSLLLFKYNNVNYLRITVNMKH